MDVIGSKRKQSLSDLSPANKSIKRDVLQFKDLLPEIRSTICGYLSPCLLAMVFSTCKDMRKSKPFPPGYYMSKGDAALLRSDSFLAHQWYARAMISGGTSADHARIALALASFSEYLIPVAIKFANRGDRQTPTGDPLCRSILALLIWYVMTNRMDRNWAFAYVPRLKRYNVPIHGYEGAYVGLIRKLASFGQHNGCYLGACVMALINRYAGYKEHKKDLVNLSYEELIVVFPINGNEYIKKILVEYLRSKRFIANCVGSLPDAEEIDRRDYVRALVQSLYSK